MLTVSMTVNDGSNVAAISLGGQHGAGFDRTAIDMNNTGPTLTGVTAYMGAAQLEVFAQELNQQGSLLHVCADGTT